ncbi:MAG: ABC transporter substrate-binding protein [Dehalococcoidia bacterium]|jgi:branched-chain amino acid transport system substrate-binding protein
MKTVSFVAAIVLSITVFLTPACQMTPTGLPSQIPIGCLMASSTTPTWGPNLIKAAQLAVDEVNAAGGIGGKSLLLIVEDEGPTPASALYAAHKLVDEDKVQVIIGGTTSDTVMNIGPYLASKGVLLVTPSATSSTLTGQSWSKWVFLVSPEDSLQGGVVAKLIKDAGCKKVATIVQDTIYGRGIEDMAEQFLKGRADIVASIKYDPAKLSYFAELNDLKDKQPDCVLHVGYYADSAVIYEQARQSGLDTIPWVTSDGVYDMPLDKYLEAAKFMEKAVTGTVPVPDLQSDAYKNFAAAYQLAFGMDPTIFCDTSYDGVNLIGAALKKGNAYNGAAIRDALLMVGKDYPGASGMITFDQSGERIAGNYGIWKVKMVGTQYQFVMTGQTVSFLKPTTP